MKSGVWKLEDALAEIRRAGPAADPYTEPFLHGSMRLGVYAPRGQDPQEPHEQDELYFVVTGSGSFVHGRQRTPFGPGDALFVAAGETHRFENFSDDLALWVVFWGPPGGE